jgi:hypothetical protein
MLQDWMARARETALSNQGGNLQDQLRRIGELVQSLRPRANAGQDISGSLPSIPDFLAGATAAAAPRRGTLPRVWWIDESAPDSGMFGAGTGRSAPAAAQDVPRGAYSTTLAFDKVQEWIVRGGFAVIGGLVIAAGLIMLAMASRD